MNAWTRTCAPLPRITMHPSSFSVDEYLHRREELLLDAPYQRGSVWTDDQRRALIRSMLMGIPVGAVIVNEREFSDDENERVFGSRHWRAVIDGRQRIEAVRAFRDGDLAIPADWLEGSHLDAEEIDVDGMVRFDGLSEIGVRMFLHLPLPMLRAHVGSLGAEAEIFRLVNSGGTAQTEETLDRAAEVEAGAR